MHWIVSLLICAAFFAAYDFFMKVAGDKVHPTLGALLVGVGSVAVMLPFLLYYKSTDAILFQDRMGLVYPLMAGICIALGGVFYLIAFSKGVDLSLGMPVQTAAVVTFTVLAGVLLLGEAFTIQRAVGIAFAVTGIVLMVRSN